MSWDLGLTAKFTSFFGSDFWSFDGGSYDSSYFSVVRDDEFCAGFASGFLIPEPASSWLRLSVSVLSKSLLSVDIPPVSENLF